MLANQYIARYTCKENVRKYMYTSISTVFITFQTSENANVYVNEAIQKYSIPWKLTQIWYNIYEEEILKSDSNIQTAREVLVKHAVCVTKSEKDARMVYLLCTCNKKIRTFWATALPKFFFLAGTTNVAAANGSSPVEVSVAWRPPTCICSTYP